MLKRLAQPTFLAVDVDEAKAQMRVDHNDDDLLITSLVRSATIHVEDNTGRQFNPTTYRLTRDRFPTEERAVIELAACPVVSVTSVKYLDGNGNLQTLDPSAYEVDTDSEPGRIVPAYGTNWPIARFTINAVRVEFVAGYSAADATEQAQHAAIPENARRLILLIATHWYENPAAVLTGTISKEIELAYQSLLWDLKWGIDA